MDAWAGYVGPSLWDDVNSFELAGSNTTDCSLDPEGHSQPPVYESSQRSLELDYGEFQAFVHFGFIGLVPSRIGIWTCFHTSDRNRSSGPQAW